MHLLGPDELKEIFPISAEGKAFISQSRVALKKILDRQDPRLLLIVGPCSIHNTREGLEYAKRLKELAGEIKDSCLIVMRAYIEKPRTRQGWKGLAQDPHLNGSYNIAEGLQISREFLTELTEMQIPIATEFLTPYLTPYIEDLITWGCIGARTSSSQIHRVLASHLSMPVGFKNTVDGSIDCAINGVLVARESHTFLNIDEEGKLSQIESSGNNYGHVVLRGSYSEPNYDEKSIQETLGALRRHELPPRVLVDCSHGNCEGHYFKQKDVFLATLRQIRAGNKHIVGMMLESNLQAGSQKIPAQLGELLAGVSITDPCLDFASTAELISSAFSQMSIISTHS